MVDEMKNDPQATGYPDPTGAYKEMVDAGVFYGRHRSKIHPRMRAFVLATRGGIEMIDLEKTSQGMANAVEFLKKRVASGGEMLLVGTQPEADQDITAVADRLKVSSVTNRWLGGTITNFKIISDRLHYWKKQRENLASGAFGAYTKKERLEIEREIQRLKELFGGIEHMAKRPDVLVVLDPRVHKTAMREAKRVKIPIIAYTNIDSDPNETEYLVVGNTKSRSSNHWFLAKIEEAYAEGVKMRAAMAPSAPAAEAHSAPHDAKPSA